MPSVVIVAGEASGDASGAALAGELRRLCPEINIWGAGGPRMCEAGVELVSDFSWAGAIGIVQSLKLVPRLLIELAQLKKEIVRRRPDVFVPIDFGAFNVKLGQFVRSQGVPSVYYFPPGSWRRRSRDHSSLLAAADKIITPFPWSAEILRNAGGDAVFVGHPILDQARPTSTRSEFFEENAILSLSKDEPQSRVIGLLPGSRKHEIENILPAFVKAGVKIAEQTKSVAAFVVAAGSDHAADHINQILKRQGIDLSTGEMGSVTGDAPVFRVLKGQTYNVMAHSDLLLTCSGTATLEAMIIGTPMVIVYRGSSLMKVEYLLRKAILEQFAGMPNIIAGREICPELLGEDASPEAIADRAISLLSDAENLRRTKDDLAVARGVLGEPGGTARAAELILDIILQHRRLD